MKQRICVCHWGLLSSKLFVCFLNSHDLQQTRDHGAQLYVPLPSSSSLIRPGPPGPASLGGRQDLDPWPDRKVPRRSKNCKKSSFRLDFLNIKASSVLCPPGGGAGGRLHHNGEDTMRPALLSRQYVKHASTAPEALAFIDSVVKKVQCRRSSFGLARSSARVASTSAVIT